MFEIINRILKYLSLQKDEVYIEIQRNEPCFCNSGKKFKNCHLLALERKGKIALYVINKHTGKKKVKILLERKYRNTTIRFRTTLTGNDIGGPGGATLD